MNSNNTPVLFLIFNRPGFTETVFEAIRKNRPAKLFVAADGPRALRNEERLCAETRAIATNVDWPCEVHTLFRDQNLGSGVAVSEAIHWFFEHVEYGVILEDDCLPDQTFFQFCEALLIEHLDNDRIMTISGTNLLTGGWRPDKQSYLFGHGGNWGWATWKRAWNKYDFEMREWTRKGNVEKIRKAMNNDNWFNYYHQMFYAAINRDVDAWDLQWLHCVLNNGGLSINPSVNLVKNLGFGPLATHTFKPDGFYSELKLNQMQFPLKHPRRLAIDKRYLHAAYLRLSRYDKSWFSLTKFYIKSVLKFFEILKRVNY